MNQEVLCRPSDYDISEITPCTHEEADVRIPLHTLHAAKHGHASIFWRTADTDVVVLGVKTLAEKEGIIADIVIGFGTRTKKSGMRYYAQPVLSILRKITCYGSRPA